LVLLLEQLKQTIKNLRVDVDELANTIKPNELKEAIDALELQTQESGFWNDSQKSQSVLGELKIKKDKYDSFMQLSDLLESTDELLAMAIEEDDESLAKDIEADVEKIQKLCEEQRIMLLLSGEYDKRNAIVSIHPGAGGTEAQDWAEMLFRMYMRFAERRGYKFKTLDYLDGDEAGIKSVTFLVEGEFAYGYFKSESGVHRLVRVSPFDSSGRRHTSFASVEVTPEFSDEITVEIREEDLKIEAHRASGAGGQHVNKTDSAIRITHIPTGVVVACQNERSQHQNKDTAMKMLKAKLVEMAERAHKEKIEDLKGDMKDIAWGSQIRSYVFHPYSMVKDHRTDCETGNIGAVMDGDLDPFINAYLKAASLGTLNLK